MEARRRRLPAPCSAKTMNLRRYSFGVFIVLIVCLFHADIFVYVASSLLFFDDRGFRNFVG